MSNKQDIKIQRVDGVKKINIFIYDSSHAEFLLKLRYDKITQKNFFKMIIESYLSDDVDLKRFISKMVDKKLSKRKKKIKDKEEKEQQKLSEDFALDENDIRNIFDIIEKENPDI